VAAGRFEIDAIEPSGMPPKLELQAVQLEEESLALARSGAA
jgi:hypothetical protein